MPHGPLSNSGAPWDARRPGAAESIARALRACSAGLAGSGARFGRAGGLTAGRAHRHDRRVLALSYLQALERESHRLVTGRGRALGIDEEGAVAQDRCRERSHSRCGSRRRRPLGFRPPSWSVASTIVPGTPLSRAFPTPARAAAAAGQRERQGQPRLRQAREAVERCEEFGRRLVRKESLVPKGGLEPPRVAPHAPQTCASASSATSARCEAAV